jgi:hypothetical protein
VRLIPLLISACALAIAQDDTRFSVSIGDELSALTGVRVPMPEAANLLLLQSSFLHRHQDRWRVSASIAAIGSTDGDTHAQVRVKEAYAGVTAGDFDFTAGKRILRWGTGYAFTPTGVLDPPRVATDPTDRLNLNEGREMIATDWVHGRHALTAVWASAGLLQDHSPGMRETEALRYDTLLAGFDSALIYAHDRGLHDFYGANFTRVIGEALEIHGEIARRDSTAVLLGGKYMLPGGVSTIAEFYSPPAPRNGRYVFFYVGKSRLRELPGWKHWDVSFSVVANATDHSRIQILDVTRRLGDHLSATLRAQSPSGKRWRSEYGMIPYSAQLSMGFWYRI